jgi:hypothetical protein
VKTWHEVDSRTRILLDKHKPLAVQTTARDLDRALDRAAQWYGEPLEEINGGWRFHENDPEFLNAEAETEVACSADLHEGAA